MADWNVTVSETGSGPYGQSIAARGHAFAADEPVDKGGRDTAPSPFELLLGAIGSCTAITVRMYANRKDWPLRDVRVSVAHRRQPGEGGREVDAFDVVLDIEGDLTPEQRERLLAIADHCPVSRAVGRGSVLSVALAGGAAVGAVD